MRGQSYSTSFVVDRQPQEVFEAIQDPTSWWVQHMHGDARQLGAEFGYEVEGAHQVRMRVTESVPAERVVWQVLDNWMSFVQDQSEWLGTEMRFDLSPQDGGTLLRFTHVGLLPDQECYEMCSSAWGMHIAVSLRNRIATGRGAPVANQRAVSG